VINNNGTPGDPTDDFIVYTPDPGFTGNDSFSYQICDSNGDCDTANVDVFVQGLGIGCQPPFNLAVSNITQTSATLTWTTTNPPPSDHCWTLTVGGKWA
jgi:hypothetical protein